MYLAAITREKIKVGPSDFGSSIKIVMGYVKPKIIIIGLQEWGQFTGFLSHGMMG